jgi:hypothetical protein
VTGQYHLERHTVKNVRVFESSIDAEELKQIVRLLSGERLYHLDQKHIPDLMMKSDNDHVVLEVHRPDSWQQLLFPDSASREPVRDTMEPLLQWFEKLNKRKMHELSEEAGRNNCLPPSKPEFAQRESPKEQKPADNAPPAAPTAPAPDYVLQMLDNRMVKSRAELTCLIVLHSGSYHMVKQTKEYGRAMKIGVLDGTINPAALAGLRAILDTPEWVNYAEQHQQTEFVFTQDSYFTHLTIPRPEKLQHVAAWKSYRIIQNVITRSIEDHGTKLFAPFREWMKANFNDKDLVSTASPANPRCNPEP